jgi:DNA-binding MarR family transcriptional regulator
MIRSRGELVGEALCHLDALKAERRRTLSDEPASRQVSMQQLHILMELQERGTLTITTLSAILGISPPSASSIVDRMEQHGLITRVRDESDRRVVRISITDRGAAAAEEVVGLHRERACRLLESMTDDELDHVVQGLAAVRRAISRLREEAEPDMSEQAVHPPNRRRRRSLDL